jgi:hypothetical protein
VALLALGPFSWYISTFTAYLEVDSMKKMGVVAALVALAACSPKYQVEVTPAPVANVDFSKYRTWIFGREGQYPPTGIEHVDTPQFRAAVATEIIADMAALGYAQVDSNPDFVMLINVGSQRHVDQQKMDEANRGYDMAWSQISDKDTWNEGTIILYAADAKSGQLIWSSTANARIQSEVGYEKRLERFNDVIVKMLAEFPSRKP